VRCPAGGGRGPDPPWHAVFPAVYDTLDQALVHARSRPPFLRERMRLATTLEAFTTAGSFAGEVCQRWQLGELAETARS
jgi:hypothetical protein